MTQAITEKRHCLDHKLIGLRVTGDCQSQSDDDEDLEDAEDDGYATKEIYNSDNPNSLDKDYATNKFASHNYLDPNFLPE